MEEALSLSQPVLWDPALLLSPLSLLVVYIMEIAPCSAEIASYSRHLSAVAQQRPLPAPSTPLHYQRKGQKSQILWSLQFVIILGATVALVALRRVNAHSCVWVRPQPRFIGSFENAPSSLDWPQLPL